ncbi:MAG: shikimate kinase [Deferrisomatales bacterium]
MILTGFMGVGKSATGAALAKLLGWSFVDLDREIEQQAGKPIPRIFAEEGEAGFRDRESEALARVLGRARTVVATGGGVLLRARNRKLLAGRIVVNLEAPPEACVERLAASPEERPLLAGADPLEEARRLYAARKPLYDAVERRVDTRGKSPEEVAREIARRFLPEALPEGAR